MGSKGGMNGRPPSPLRRRRAAGCIGILAALLAATLVFPVTTRRGVNYRISASFIPLGLKLTQFVQRDRVYRRLAREIPPAAGEAERIRSLLDWVRRNVKPQPRQAPIVDDHILNIVERGYGAADQRADVFATLATYAGMPAFWKFARLQRPEQQIVFTFVYLDGGWTVWDVERGYCLQDAEGRWLHVTELQRHPERVRDTVGDLTHGGRSYEEYIRAALGSFEVPRPLRAERQMLGKRIVFEYRKALGSLRQNWK